MPVRPVRRLGRDNRYRLIGYMWGHHGKLYTIRRWGKKGAYDKAARQGIAIKISQTRHRKKKNENWRLRIVGRESPPTLVVG